MRVYCFLIDLQVALQILRQLDVRCRKFQRLVLHLVDLLAHLNEVTRRQREVLLVLFVLLQLLKLRQGDLSQTIRCKGFRLL